jgi:hypothetical protein
MSESGPPTTQPWLLLGERRRRLLESRLRVAAERWATQWIASTVTVSVAVEPAARNPPVGRDDPSTIRFAARRQGEWLAELAVPSRLVAWAAGLGTVEFSAAADLDQSSSGGAIELELMRGFWSLLTGPAVVEAAPLECLEASQAEEARLALVKRGLSVLCDFGPAGCTIQAMLGPIMFETLLAERRGSYVGESLLSRRSAFTQAGVALDCCLGSVQVPVRDLHSLRIGDVLVTDIALDGQAELRVRNQPRPIAAGTLGEVEGRKAFKIETAQVATANRGLRR